MSQSSFPTAGSLGSSTTSPRLSDETLKRFVPRFRAVVDAFLIFFGMALVYIHGTVVLASWNEIEYLDQIYYVVSQLILTLSGLAIVYCTGRSSYWRSRQRVLFCLAIVLFQYAVVGLILLRIIEFPEYLELIDAILLKLYIGTALSVVLIGAIAIEKRIRLGGFGEELPERIASRRQMLGRIIGGFLFAACVMYCLYLPFFYVNGILSGSFLAFFEKLYGTPINSLNFFCLTLIAVFNQLTWLGIAVLCFLYLNNYHQLNLKPLKELDSNPTCMPAVLAAAFCYLGVAIHCFLFAVFGIGPSAAPWIVLATIIVAGFVYRKAAAMVVLESTEK